ncbi:MAG: flagellar hook protein FlgE [Lysobacterales bacterium CG17_big_fil_post_rev_8_21_14_2_50_64_11]|nr:MAG: flagellar hook protein FlgE [Xanthomonadales bacterium CG17_big_fil_post_rev_8_21_14_2_50_64_11]
MPFNLALSGLNAASSDLEVTANNIANVNSTGFKGSRAEFADVFSLTGSGVSSIAIGNGVRLASVSQQFGQGNIEFTNNNLDLAISGQGFFTTRNDSGLAYTRAGNFSVNRDGFVVNPSGQKLQVFPPSTPGNFDVSRIQDLQLSLPQSPPIASTQAALTLNVPSTATPPPTTPFDPNDPTSFNNATSFTVFDSLGAAHTASVFYVKDAAPNAWNVELQIDGVSAGPAQPITFDTSGGLATPVNGMVAFPAMVVSPNALPLTLALDMAKVTQTSDTFSVAAISQDGAPTGRLTGIDIGADGVVSARFSNGQSNALGQLAITNFANPEGLQQLGDTSWSETFASGAALRGQAGSGSVGLVQSGALEASNVDLTAQLVNMIKAQRNFQANAQMISTADRITQTVINIRN